MAELTLTEDEKKANSWLDLEDSALGKMVKATALQIKEGPENSERVWFMSAAILMCSLANDVNADTSKTDLKGLTHAGKPFGDWRVTIKRLKA